MRTRPGTDPFPDALFRRFLEENKLGAGLIDSRADVRWVNGTLASMMHTTAETMTERSAFDYIHPDDLERAAGAFAAVDEGYNGTQGRFRVCRDDGSIVPVDLFLSPIADALTLDDGTTEPLYVILFRIDDYQHAFSEALERIGEGRAFSDVAAAVLDGVQYEDRQLVTGIACVDDGAEPVTLGPLPSILLQHDPDDSSMETSPWRDASAGGQPIQFRMDDLAPRVAEEARKLGLAGGVVLPFDDPWSGVPVLLTGWTDDADHLDVFQLALNGQPRRILRLAIERRHHERQLHDTCRRDALTGLGNRRLLFEALANRRDDVDQRPTGDLALTYLDLDDFKPVNDLLGHATGDGLLRTLSDALRSAAPDDAVVARFGGDEFVVLVSRASIAEEEAMAIAEKLRTAMSASVDEGGVVLEVVATAGVAVAPVTVDPDRLVRAADDALYAAKRGGKGRSHVVTVAAEPPA